MKKILVAAVFCMAMYLSLWGSDETVKAELSFDITSNVEIYVGQTYSLEMSYSNNCIGTVGGVSIYNSTGATLDNTYANRTKVAGKSKRVQDHITSVVSGNTLKITGNSVGTNVVCIFKLGKETSKSDDIATRKITVKVVASPTATVKDSFAWAGSTNNVMSAEATNTLGETIAYKWNIVENTSASAQPTSNNVTLKNYTYQAPNINSTGVVKYQIYCTATYSTTVKSPISVRSNTANICVYTKPNIKKTSIKYLGGQAQIPDDKMLSVISKEKLISDGTLSDIYLYPGQKARLNVQRDGSSLNTTDMWSVSKTEIAKIVSSDDKYVEIEAMAVGEATVTALAKSSPSGLTQQTASQTVNIHVLSPHRRELRVGGNSVSRITVNNQAPVLLALATLGKCSYTEDISVYNNSQNFLTLENLKESGAWSLSPKSSFSMNDTAYVTVETELLNDTNPIDKVVENAGEQTFKQQWEVKLGKAPTTNNSIVMITDMWFEKAEVKLIKGQQKDFIPNRSPSKETTLDLFDWKSSNNSVAVVDSNGTVTAKSIGRTTITAFAKDGSGKKASYVIYVLANSPKGVSAKSSKGGILLSWNRVDGCKNYYIYRKQGNDNWKKIGMSNENEYTDATVNWNKKYKYRIVALPDTQKEYCASYPSSAKIVTHRLAKVKKYTVKKIRGGYKLKIKGSKYSGYQIFVAKKKAYIKASHYANIKTKNASLFGVPKGSKYICVRSYYVVNNKKVYSKYSKVKRI